MQTRPATAPPDDRATDAARYDAIRRRDPASEGRFVYSVATTGVYCRPTCGARLPLPRNVAFHSTPDEAERAGFRPCKRCRPRDLPRAERDAATVDGIRAILDDADAPIGLVELARRACLSPHHLHRLFKKHVGMTPREYAAASRLQRVGEELRDGASVTTAIHEAGYSSSGRFYQADSGALGMKPSELRAGGQRVQMRAVERGSSLGPVLIAATERGVCAILFHDGRDLAEELRERFPRADVGPPDDGLETLATRVIEIIDSAGLAADLPLDLVGTAFQQRVWRALQQIPRGTTATYGEIARRIGAPRAVRAVGTACGQNAVAVAIPCHRVVREDGSLGGYRWGLDRKRALLEREGSR